MLPGFHNAFIPSTPTRSDVRYNPIHEEGDFPVLNTLGVDIPEVDVEMADCENSPKHVDGIESLDWNEEVDLLGYFPLLTHFDLFSASTNHINPLSAGVDNPNTSYVDGSIVALRTACSICGSVSCRMQ